jgi:hypothetical protein
MMMDHNECEAIGGMLGKGHRSTRRKPAPVPIRPPQISHDLNLARTRAAEVGSRRLTARVTAHPITKLTVMSRLAGSLHF